MSRENERAKRLSRDSSSGPLLLGPSSYRLVPNTGIVPKPLGLPKLITYGTRSPFPYTRTNSAKWSGDTVDKQLLYDKRKHEQDCKKQIRAFEQVKKSWLSWWVTLERHERDLGRQAQGFEQTLKREREQYERQLVHLSNEFDDRQKKQEVSEKSNLLRVVERNRQLDKQFQERMQQRWQQFQKRLTGRLKRQMQDVQKRVERTNAKYEERLVLEGKLDEEMKERKERLKGFYLFKYTWEWGRA